MRPRPQPQPPGPGQESVWDYPRPPRIEPAPARLRAIIGETVIAETINGVRVLETSHPPVYYFPPDDIRMDLFAPAHGTTFCEFKGRASYLDYIGPGKRIERIAWFYPQPVPAFAALAGYCAVYAGKTDACFVGDERVDSQRSGFYGGWITSNIVGPFKGEPGTEGW